MIKREEMMNDLKKTEAFLSGHFLLSSGLHSEGYVQCALLLQYPDLAEKYCKELGKKLETFEPDIVVAPALGGVVAGFEVARYLNKPGLFTERKKGEMMLRRGFTITPGQKVLIIEDVVTTGGSVKEVIDVVKEHGGEIVAVGSLIDRSGGQADFDVPFQSLLALEVATYDPEDCPLCAEGQEVVKPGSRNN